MKEGGAAVGLSRYDLDSQTLAALGAASVDHSATATGFHADQKAVGASATNFGRLVCAFHFGNPKRLKQLIAWRVGARARSAEVRFSPESVQGTADYRKFLCPSFRSHFSVSLQQSQNHVSSGLFRGVDKVLIN
jgi:hypothetical protein